MPSETNALCTERLDYCNAVTTETDHPPVRRRSLHSRSVQTSPTLRLRKVKVKVNVDLYSALSNALRHGTRSQGISQFYLHTPRTSANGMNHAFAFLAEAGTHLPTREEWKAELALGGWLVTYRIDVQHQELNPDMVAHLSTHRARRRLTSLIEANALTTTPDHQVTTTGYRFRRDLKTFLFHYVYGHQDTD